MFLFRNGLIEVPGKRGRKVPILLTPEIAKSLAVLVTSRIQCNVLGNNKYVFAIPGYETYIRGDIAMRNVVKRVPLKRPELMKAMELRRHVGTMCQVLQLTDNEVGWLSRHLGHSVQVHQEFYQLHHSTLELTRVALMLQMIDEGKAAMFKDRQLRDITPEGKVCKATLKLEH